MAEIFRSPDLHMALFFALFMLDDPPTCPAHHRDQIWFGGLVAAVSFAAFELWGWLYFLLAGLLVGNVAWALVRTARNWRRSQRRRGRERRATRVLARGIDRGI